jgi:hypothetical protein
MEVIAIGSATRTSAVWGIISRLAVWSEGDGVLTNRARKAAQRETCRGLEERFLGV